MLTTNCQLQRKPDSKYLIGRVFLVPVGLLLCHLDTRWGIQPAEVPEQPVQRPMKKCEKYQLPAILMACALALPAVAGPVAPTDAATAEPPAEAPTSISPRPAGAEGTDSRNDARTVDLLIEMQGRSAGLTFNERTRQPSSGALPVRQTEQAAAPAVEAPTVPTSRAGLFGAAAVPQGPAKGINLNEQSNYARGEPDSPRPGGNGGAKDHQADQQEGDLRWLLPRTLVLWVRENRLMVIAGALVLVGMVWAGSIIGAGRRR